MLKGEAKAIGLGALAGFFVGGMIGSAIAGGWGGVIGSVVGIIVGAGTLGVFNLAARAIPEEKEAIELPPPDEAKSNQAGPEDA